MSLNWTAKHCVKTPFTGGNICCFFVALSHCRNVALPHCRIAAMSLVATLKNCSKPSSDLKNKYCLMINNYQLKIWKMSCVWRRIIQCIRICLIIFQLGWFFARKILKSRWLGCSVVPTPTGRPNVCQDAGQQAGPAGRTGRCISWSALVGSADQVPEPGLPGQQCGPGQNKYIWKLFSLEFW